MNIAIVHNRSISFLILVYLCFYCSQVFSQAISIESEKKLQHKKVFTEIHFSTPSDKEEITKNDVCYRYSRHEKWYYHIANKNYGPYEAVGTLVTKGVADHWALPVKIKGAWYVISPNKRYGPYAEIKSVTLGAKNGAIGIVTRKQGGEYLNIDSQVYGPYELAQAPRFSPDGTRWAFNLQFNGQWQTIFNDSTYAGPFLFPSDIQFLDSGHIATLRYIKNYNHYAKIDKKEYGPYHVVNKIITGPKNQWALMVQAIDGWRVLVNDSVNVGPYEQLSAFTFSKDGENWGFAGSFKGTWRPIINGVLKPDSIPYLPTIFIGTEHWHMAGSVNDSLMIDSKKYGPFEYALSPQFDSTYADWKFVAKRKDTLFVISKKDTLYYKAYYDMKETRFSNNLDFFSFLGQRNNKWYLVANGEEIAEDPLDMHILEKNGILYLYWIERKKQKILVKKYSIKVS